jgi:hypothetical protein
MRYGRSGVGTVSRAFFSVPRRSALAMRGLAPSAAITLATGRADLAGRVPVGEVIDRAATWQPVAGDHAGGCMDQPKNAKDSAAALDPAGRAGAGEWYATC